MNYYKTLHSKTGVSKHTTPKQPRSLFNKALTLDCAKSRFRNVSGVSGKFLAVFQLNNRAVSRGIRIVSHPSPLPHYPPGRRGKAVGEDRVKCRAYVYLYIKTEPKTYNNSSIENG